MGALRAAWRPIRRAVRTLFIVLTVIALLLMALFVWLGDVADPDGDA